LTVQILSIQVLIGNHQCGTATKFTNQMWLWVKADCACADLQMSQQLTLKLSCNLVVEPCHNPIIPNPNPYLNYISGLWTNLVTTSADPPSAFHHRPPNAKRTTQHIKPNSCFLGCVLLSVHTH